MHASLRGGPIPAFGWAAFVHPKISIKKKIVKLNASTGAVYFPDGSVLHEIDQIIYATGYTFSFPYLPAVQERVKKAYRRLPGVYQHTFDVLDPTLALVRMVSTPPKLITWSLPSNYN